MNIDVIFTKTVIETWRERIDSGECTLYEAEVALKRARDNCSPNLNNTSKVEIPEEDKAFIKYQEQADLE